MAKDIVGNPYMTKDMAHLILKLKLLHRIKKGEIYSYALIKEFDNPHISKFLKTTNSSAKNDIYNTIKALEKSGYLNVKTKVEDGRLKKYYSLSKNGMVAMKDSKRLFVKSMKELMKIIK